MIEEILPRFDNIVLARSATTRPRREGEQQGREYYFLSPAEFKERVNKGDFIEHVKYGAHCYGTLKSEVEDNLKHGRNVILEIETEGAQEIERRMPEAVLFFIEPPSESELRKRLEGRNTEAPGDIAIRLERAREELAVKKSFDYIIINKSISKAAEELEDKIKQALREA